MSTSTLPRACASPEWKSKCEFENISWNDIVEAEENGNVQTLNNLRVKSLETKKTHSRRGGCHSPDTPLPSRPSRNTPNSDRRSLTEYPCLPSQSINTLPFDSPVETLSYAQALEPRLTKRTMNDRTCLSPIDYLPKRSALSKTPTNVGPNTPHSPTTTMYAEDFVEVGVTPNSDSRPNKPVGAAQRRLFPPSTENMDPVFTMKQSPLSEDRSRSASVSSSPCDALSDRQLAQRQKQIDYGKNTMGYQKYLQVIPRWKRTREHPWTPEKSKACSTRSWQGQIRVWRRALHKYDPPTQSGSQFTAEEAALCHMDFLKD